ncbi:MULTISPECIES: Panacea domain-containing protein [unclassified Exiguobacterium]|uniref:Panacea domain-containing protein n=1 Tax=unclassified Exiguobacterium TaxID=2644629 RepID=UPI0013760A04|nr:MULTISPECIES: type II toxin-antitoxin system antitoxin SocA domain-containing protein [unclassified Exiguobacterium]
MARAIEVAKYLIYLKNTDEKNGQFYSLSNLKLQKLLYYCQGGHYTWDGERLIEDQLFEAWTYGPVIRNIYYEFKEFGQNDIEVDIDITELDLQENELETIQAVWNQLKDFSAFNLVDSTHAEAPWQEAKDSEWLYISENSISEFFQSL